MNVKYILLRILSSYLKHKATPNNIRKYIKQKNIQKTNNLDEINFEKIKVAVVQEEIQYLKTYKEYIDFMYRFIKDAADNGVQLICFPENNGLLLLGMIPFIEMVLKKINTNKLDDDSKNKSKAKTKSDSKVSIVEIFKVLDPFIKTTFITVFSELSKAFGIYIMAGSVLVEEKGKVYNRAYLFDSIGEVLGVQDKAHLLDIEAKLGISASQCLRVFDTQIGKVAFPVCMDATYFETFKILKSMGAQIVIVPIANMEEYNDYLALRGIWPRVQESGLYGLKSALVGNIGGLKFTGKAAIFAPMSLTKEGNGIIKEVETYNREELLVTELDLTLLDAYNNPYFSDTNPEVYNRYLPKLYEKHCNEVLLR